MSYTKQTEGSMFVYESAVPTVIDVVSQYHAIQIFGEGSMIDGVTFTEGINGAITDTDDNAGVLRCTDVAHGLTTGQYVTLTGMGDAAHVGSTAVTVIDVDTFDCDDIAWSSDGDTGNWQRGASLTVNEGNGGGFALDWSVSSLSAGNNKNYKFELVKNNSDLDEFASERKFAAGNDLGSMGGGGLVSLESGDVIWIQVKGTTDATDLTIRHGNVHINKI